MGTSGGANMNLPRSSRPRSPDSFRRRSSRSRSGSPRRAVRPGSPRRAVRSGSPRLRYVRSSVHNPRAQSRRLRRSAANGDIKAVELLLDQKASLELVDSTTGNNALHEAISCRSITNDLLQLIINFKGDVGSTNYEGQTPLMLAAFHGVAEGASATWVLEALIANDAEVTTKDACGVTAGLFAAAAGNAAGYKLLLSTEAAGGAGNRSENVRGCLEVCDNLGLTAAMQAARHDHVNLLKILVDADVDLSAADNSGMTAMMYAASAEAESSAAFSLIARILGSGGVSQPHKNRMLLLAAFAGSASTVQWLIDASADPNTEECGGDSDCTEGLSPLMLAAEGIDSCSSDQCQGSRECDWHQRRNGADARCDEPRVRLNIQVAGWSQGATRGS